MLTVEEALDRVLGYASVLEPQATPILEAMGGVLAGDIRSSIDIPPLDNAAMDGYAVRAADTDGASRESPRVLSVTETVAAGYIAKRRVEPGTAIRIMTGAPVPAGADAVVPFELTDETERSEPGKIGIRCQAHTGDNIRRAGEDISKGSLVLERGMVLRASEVGVLASLGMGLVDIIRRPVLAILATGDELVELGQPLPPGRIYNSNSYSVAALVRKYGAVPKMLGIAHDSEESVISKLAGLNADMLITSGGVSAGDYDVVKDVLARQGEIAFWTVRMKPGKPLAFGRIRLATPRGEKYIPHLGLPGNPVSSMITFELFARPAILKMMGRPVTPKPEVTAVIESPVKNTDGRRIFARAVVVRQNGHFHARLTGPQGSGILTSMARANGLAIIPEDTASVKPGDKVKVIMLDWSEEL